MFNCKSFANTMPTSIGCPKKSCWSHSAPAQSPVDSTPRYQQSQPDLKESVYKNNFVLFLTKTERDSVMSLEEIGPTVIILFEILGLQQHSVSNFFGTSWKQSLHTSSESLCGVSVRSQHVSLVSLSCGCCEAPCDDFLWKD